MDAESEFSFRPLTNELSAEMQAAREYLRENAWSRLYRGGRREARERGSRESEEMRGGGIGEKAQVWVLGDDSGVGYDSERGGVYGSARGRPDGGHGERGAASGRGLGQGPPSSDGVSAVLRRIHLTDY